MKDLFNNALPLLNDGCVLVAGHDFEERWRPWGHPEGFGVTGTLRKNQTHHLQPIFLDYLTGKGDLSHYTGACRAIESIKKSIPADIRRIVRNLSEWPIELIQLGECNPKRFKQLAKTNPALLLLLAREIAICPLWGANHYGKLLNRQQNHIARALGHPSGFAKFLSKFINLKLCTSEWLDMAIKVWRKTYLRKILAHVEYVNLDTLLTARYHAKIIKECPSLLNTACDSPSNNPLSSKVYEEVESIVQLRKKMDKPSWPWTKIQNIDHLSKISLRTRNDAICNGQISGAKFPEPPVSSNDDWELVSNSCQLNEHAKNYSNCAQSLLWKCLTGDAAIYVSRLRTYDDTIIVLLTKEADTWLITTIEGPENTSLCSKDEAQARKHFEEELSR